MKTKTFPIILGLSLTSFVCGQGEENTVVRVVPPTANGGALTEQTEEPVVGQVQDPAGAVLPNAQPGAQPGAAVGGDPAAQPEEAVAAPEVNPIEEEDGGFLIKDANINDIFQLLSKRAGKQYFHNNKINTDEYKVTGHLNGDAPALKQMEELAFQYGLRMYVKGNTVYAMMDTQLDKLPAKEWTYRLGYLRPTDMEQIKALVQPLLTPGRGIVNFEPKTNTIVVIDTMHHIEMVESLLRKIDKPKGQIVVEVKILRVNSGIGQKTGVDWSTSLGSKGVPVDVIRSLNSVFGLQTDFTGKAISGGAAAGATEDAAVGTSNIILTPFQLSGVLRALHDGNMVKQKSNPVVITEDNEKAIISLIDRVPIITSTVNNTGNGASTTTDEVRYKIDQSDPTDPDKTREIGVTITLTPSLLPDGTIRMNMRPRNAQIVENITGPSGNSYPRVSEATIESITRIPDGHSLIVGGFYGQLDSKAKNRVPLLGEVPVIRFFFRSKQTRKEQSSLVFVVTPTSYDPACVSSHRTQTSRIRREMGMRPGFTEDKSKIRDRIRGARPVRQSGYPQRFPNK